MEWIRGDLIGKGSFGDVNLAILKTSCSSFMAVKSCLAANSASLRREKKHLKLLKGCPQIISCYGDSSSRENGEDLYNVFLEYAPGGNLSDQGALTEYRVRRYTKAILKGLIQIHDKGLVHCDLKLDNILVFSNGDVKIADFGLCKEKGEKTDGFEIKGSPMYLSPECISESNYESPADIWAVGCAVSEMFSGRKPWSCQKGTEITQLLYRIAMGEETPEIPDGLSEQGKDFLGRCFIKDPKKRATAEDLLNHPFVLNVIKEEEEEKEELWSWISPRGPLDLSFCSSVPVPENQCPIWNDEEFQGFDSMVSRIQPLATTEFPYWSPSDGWINVRG